MMKSILIFLMVATGAALHTGHGAGEHFAAPMVAPASRVPVKPHQENKKECATTGKHDDPPNAGLHCAYHHYTNAKTDQTADTKDATVNATDARSRCCCYPLQGTTTCFKWTDDTIKALLADSKLEHGHVKKDTGKDGNQKVKAVPWAERKGYAAIKHLVSIPHWCPDIESKKGWFKDYDWCPDWHSASWYSAHQVSPVQFDEVQCIAAKADDDYRKEGCIDQIDPGDNKKYEAAELVEKVDFDYHEDEMCCCYTYPDYSGVVGDTEACYRMFHEDVVYVQEQLGLWSDGQNETEDKIHDEDLDEEAKNKRSGKHSKVPVKEHKEKQAKGGRKVLGLRIDEGGKHKCPKAHWEESWEITANAAAEIVDWLPELVGIKSKDHNDGGFSYPCPTKKKHTRIRTCAARILGPLCAKAVGFHAYYDSVMEPSNSANSFWGCPASAEYWMPRLCY